MPSLASTPINFLLCVPFIRALRHIEGSHMHRSSHAHLFKQLILSVAVSWLRQHFALSMSKVHHA
jgi:hypothetical protein